MKAFLGFILLFCVCSNSKTSAADTSEQSTAMNSINCACKNMPIHTLNSNENIMSGSGSGMGGAGGDNSSRCNCSDVTITPNITMSATTSMTMNASATVVITASSDIPPSSSFPLTTTDIVTTTSTDIVTTTSTDIVTTTSTDIVTTSAAATISVTASETPPVGDGGGADESSGSNTGAIAAGLTVGLGLPIIILTVIAIVVCYKLYVYNPRKQLKRESDSKELLDDEYNINGSTVVNGNVTSEIAKETSFNRPSFPAIDLEDLPTVVSDLHENDDAGFTNEYRFIKQSSPAFSQTHAYLDTNMEKNRYRNILPFNDTRVLLKIGGRNVTENYINANYIDGYAGKHAYIAAQGPLPNTVAEFWQMVWEQRCEIIVMLTGLVEGGKRKCTQYWPDPQDGTLEYGNTEVKFLAQKQYSFYNYTTLEISQSHATVNAMMRSDKRTIYHFAFTQWPDFGVPTNPQTMLRFTRIVRNKIPLHRNVPLLVHCSAGVGRTGTFITIDVMLQKMAKKQALGIKEFVLGMRYQRNNMVQTESQYVFLYDALLEAYMYGDTAVQAKNLKRHVWSLTQDNQTTQMTGMEEEYSRLPSCSYAQEVFTHALSTDNMRKNRDKSYIPFDFNRIVIGDEQKYINAVAVKGYSEEIEFIATQHPLVNTIGDFWTMVYEQNVKVIVMLGSLKNIKDSYLRTTRHPVVITKEMDTQYYTVTHATIQAPQEHSVVHYTFKAWVPEKDAPSRKSMLSLLKEVHSVNDPGHPIVVHSATSMTKEGSGVYCALTMCLDSLNNEGYVDVFQVVRTLREQRPYILYSKELYKFIYYCLVEFIQTHQSNETII